MIASLINIRLLPKLNLPHSPWWLYNRLANAARLSIFGRVEITWRMPWLRGPVHDELRAQAERAGRA